MKKVLLLLSEGFEMFEAASFSDVFGWNAIIGTKDIKLVTCGLQKTVQSLWSFKTEVDLIISDKMDFSDFDALVIPGGFGRGGFFKDIKNESLKKMIQNFYSHDKFIAGICTGVLLLGEADILKNKKVTTYLRENKRYFNQLAYYGAFPIFEEIVIDNKLITSSAPKTAIEVAFILLEKLSSKQNVDFIKTEMGF